MNRDSQHASVHLTSREMEVLRMVSAGLSSKHIGARLGITPKTVDAYIEHIRMKIGATNRVHMATLAFTLGLLDTGSDGNE